jgi:hypothetical protein
MKLRSIRGAEYFRGPDLKNIERMRCSSEEKCIGNRRRRDQQGTEMGPDIVRALWNKGASGT